MDTLFTWCSENGVPVMAHTAESMGANDDADEYSKPEGWQELYKHFAGKIDPIVDAGHFGGDTSKTSTSPNDWPKRFAEIAKNHPFYGDLGYWNSLTDCGSGQAGCSFALARLQAAVTANPEVVNRIMYGTDWFMLSKEPDWGGYARQLASNLQDRLPIECLFYRNAISCFGLAEGGAQGNRIRERFKKAPGGIPNWLRDA